MKKQLLWILIGGMGFLLFSSMDKGYTGNDTFPADIGAILTTSCFDCHNQEGRSDDAKKAVQFDLWDNYRVTKKIGILGKMAEVVEEGKMPPKKYLENKPGAALSEAQRNQLVEWTKKESERLMQGN